MEKENKEEYYFLTDKLEEITWALEGKCNDIDCDKYMYKELLKKKYRPVLEHGFSCMKKLKMEKTAVMRLLSQKKYRKFRFEKCSVCKRLLDKLDEKNKIVSFTRPSPTHRKYYEWKGFWTHKNCAKNVKTPKGWENSSL